MKPMVRNSVGLFSAALLAFALSACEGDPGPAGPPGTTECFTCHTDDFQMANFLLPKEQEYSVSQHALGDTYLRRDAPCSRCHTNEGHQTWLATGVETDMGSTSKIQCWTCHAPHTNGDFSQRRQNAPVEFEVEGVYTSTAMYDYEESNTCASCHQPRPANPPIADGANVTSSRWGPHHGPQSAVFMGTAAWAFPGVTYATGPSHATTIADGCVHCHMATPSNDEDFGGHTFRVAEGGTVNSHGCIECHDSWMDDDDATDEVEMVQDAFKIELNKVRDQLATMGFLRTPTDADNIPLTTASSSAPIVTSADTLGCIWNYYLLAEDKSLSVHNPKYANDVLDATKAFLGIP